MTLTVTQRERLEASIKHWEENVEKENNGLRPDISTRACACCNEYFEQECLGCPIAEHTGSPHCLKTPYHKLAAFFTIEDPFYNDDGEVLGLPASAMLDWLVDLYKKVRND